MEVEWELGRILALGGGEKEVDFCGVEREGGGTVSEDWDRAAGRWRKEGRGQVAAV